MTQEQIDNFRITYKRIVHQTGMITLAANHIRKMSHYDKDGSHKNAIIKAIENKRQSVLVLNEMLNGKTYDEWQDMSRKISKLTSRLKSAPNKKLQIEQDIENLKF